MGLSFELHGTHRPSEGEDHQAAQTRARCDIAAPDDQPGCSGGARVHGAFTHAGVRNGQGGERERGWEACVDSATEERGGAEHIDDAGGWEGVDSGKEAEKEYEHGYRMNG